MQTVELITPKLLETLAMKAKANSRLRINHNFHLTDDALSQRLLNSVEPGSYIPPHRHLGEARDETLIVLKGKLGVVIFNEEGQITNTALLGPNCPAIGINIPHGVFHSAVALESGTVLFEAKAGPYAPSINDERAKWAPTESEVITFMEKIKQLFAIELAY